MLLQLGDPADLTGAYLAWLARRRGLTVRELPEDGLGHSWSFLTTDDRVRQIVTADGPVPLTEVTGVFVRLNPSPAIPGGPVEDGGLDEAMAAFAVPERRAGLHYLLDILPALVVNRPTHGRSNGCKPLHMRELAGAGFDVPRWVATNDADQAEELASRSPAGAVVKAASGLRSHVRRWTTEMRTRFDAGTAPHVVQEFIEGDEVRVHVVGESVFAARIEATVTDYRFDTTSVHYDDCTPPGEIAQRCVDHARREGLPLAGFDFRVDRTGRWYCLEMNPVPSFLPYEAGTGAMIGDAVIDLLAPGSGRLHRVSPLRALQLS